MGRALGFFASPSRLPSLLPSGKKTRISATMASGTRDVPVMTFCVTMCALAVVVDRLDAGPHFERLTRGQRGRFSMRHPAFIPRASG